MLFIDLIFLTRRPILAFQQRVAVSLRSVGLLSFICPNGASTSLAGGTLGQTRKPENSLLEKVMTTSNLHTKRPLASLYKSDQ
jgi:hypothetical protein